MSASDEYDKGRRGILTGSGWNLRGQSDQANVEAMKEQLRSHPLPVPDQPSWPVLDSNLSTSTHLPAHNRTGIGKKIGGGLFNFGKWFVDHIWPLSASVRLGQRLAKVGWKVRLPLAILGAFIGPGLIVNNNGKPPVWPWAQMLLTDLAGHYAILVALGLGVAVGWVLPTIVSLVLILAAFLTGLGIGLGLIASVGVMAYKVIDAIVGGLSKDGHSRPKTIEQSTQR